jgi:RNA polymerase sigma factor (sigma-70 family)
MSESNRGNDTHSDEPLQTRQSLLLRLKDGHDEPAWREFYALYQPLLFQYACARGLQPSDADDVCSDCLAAVVKQMPQFVYDRARGGFRRWLRTIAVRRIIDRMRSRGLPIADSGVLNQLPDDSEDTDEAWDREWKHQHLKHCLEHARAKVNDQTWQVFELLVDHNTPVADVCSQLEVTPNQVYKARTRVLELVRNRMKYLMADEA